MHTRQVGGMLILMVIVVVLVYQVDLKEGVKEEEVAGGRGNRENYR